MFQGQHLRRLWTWCWWHSTLTQWKKSVQAPGTPRCSSHMVLVLCVMLQSRSVMVYCKGKLAIWINMAIVWTVLLFEWVLQQTVSADCWRLAQESALEICTNKSSQNCKKNSFFSFRAAYSESILHWNLVRICIATRFVCVFIVYCQNSICTLSSIVWLPSDLHQWIGFPLQKVFIFRQASFPF